MLIWKSFAFRTGNDEIGRRKAKREIEKCDRIWKKKRKEEWKKNDVKNEKQADLSRIVQIT